MPHPPPLPTVVGTPLDIARAVCDCTPGGAVMLSSEAFHRAVVQLGFGTEQMTPRLSAPRPSLLLNEASPRASPRPSFNGESVTQSRLASFGNTIVYAGDFKMEKLDSSMASLPLFMAVPGELEARLPHLPPIRYAQVNPPARMPRSSPVPYRYFSK